MVLYLAFHYVVIPMVLYTAWSCLSLRLEVEMRAANQQAAQEAWDDIVARSRSEFERRV